VQHLRVVNRVVPFAALHRLHTSAEILSFKPILFYGLTALFCMAITAGINKRLAPVAGTTHSKAPQNIYSPLSGDQNIPFATKFSHFLLSVTFGDSSGVHLVEYQSNY
jgi:hypothetical protein